MDHKISAIEANKLLSNIEQHNFCRKYYTLCHKISAIDADNLMSNIEQHNFGC